MAAEGTEVYLSEKPSVEARGSFYDKLATKAEIVPHDQFGQQAKKDANIAHFAAGIAILSPTEKGLYGPRILVDRDAFTVQERDFSELIPTFVRHEAAEIYIYARGGFSLATPGLVIPENTVSVAHGWAIHEQWRFAFENGQEGLLNEYLLAKSDLSPKDRAAYAQGFKDISEELKRKGTVSSATKQVETKVAELKEPVKISLAEVQTVHVEGEAARPTTSRNLDAHGDSDLQLIVDGIEARVGITPDELKMAQNQAFQRFREAELQGTPIPGAREFMRALSVRINEASAEFLAQNAAAAAEYRGHMIITAEEAKDRFREACYKFRDPEKKDMIFEDSFLAAETWVMDRIHGLRVRSGPTGAFAGTNDDRYAELQGADELIRDLSEPLWLYVHHTFSLMDLGATLKNAGGDFKQVIGAAQGVGAEAYEVVLGWKKGRPYGRERDSKGRKQDSPDYDSPDRVGEKTETADALRLLAELHDDFVNEHRENLSSTTKALAKTQERIYEPLPGDLPDARGRGGKTHRQIYLECLDVIRSREKAGSREFPIYFKEAALAIDIYASWNETIKPGKTEFGAYEGRETISGLFYGVQRLKNWSESRTATPASQDYDPHLNEGGEFKRYQGKYFERFFIRFLPYLCQTTSMEDEAYYYDGGACKITERHNESLVGAELVRAVPLMEKVFAEEPVLTWNKKSRKFEEKKDQTGRVIKRETGKLLLKTDGTPMTKPAQKRKWNPDTTEMERVFKRDGSADLIEEQDRRWDPINKEEQYKFTNGGREVWYTRRQVTHVVTKDRVTQKVLVDKWCLLVDGKPDSEITQAMVPAKGYVVEDDLSKVKFEDISWIGANREQQFVSGIIPKYWAYIIKLDTSRGLLVSESDGPYADPKMDSFIKFMKHENPVEKLEPRSAREDFYCSIAIPTILYRLRRDYWPPDIKAIFDNPDEDHYQTYLAPEFASFVQRDNANKEAGSAMGTIDPEQDDYRELIHEVAKLTGYPLHVRPDGPAFKAILRYFGVPEMKFRNIPS